MIYDDQSHTTQRELNARIISFITSVTARMQSEYAADRYV
jgi:hypothetical protein